MHRITKTTLYFILLRNIIATSLSSNGFRFQFKLQQISCICIIIIHCQVINLLHYWSLLSKLKPVKTKKYCSFILFCFQKVQSIAKTFHRASKSHSLFVLILQLLQIITQQYNSLILFAEISTYQAATNKHLFAS